MLLLKIWPCYEVACKQDSLKATSKPKNVITLEKPKKYLQLKNLNYMTVMELNCHVRIVISALTKMPSSSQNCLFPFISLTLSTRNKNMSRIYYQILSSETWAASCCRLPCQDTDPACEEQCPRLPTTIALKFWILLAEVLLIKWTLTRWFWHWSQDQKYSGWIPFSGVVLKRSVLSKQI